MHVDALGEGAQQRFVVAQVRHDAQLDLAVVGAGDHMARRRDERLAHPPAFRSLDRNVLQVGIGARQAPRDRHRLRIVGVDAPGARIRHLRQLVGVGALELGQATVLQQLGRQRKILSQLLQHLLVGAGCAARRLLNHRQTQLGKEDFADLLGRSEVEGLTRQLVRLFLQLHDPHAQLGALLRQDRRIDQDAGALDAVKRLAAGDLQLVDEAQLCIALDLGPQRQVHVERLVRVLARVLGSLVDGDLRERNLVRALAGDIHVIDAAATQMPFGQAGQPMRLVDFEHIALQHRVVRIALHFDAMVGQHMPVVFDVLAELGPRRVFQPRLEPRQHLTPRQLRGHIAIAVSQRNIGCDARLGAERDSDDLGLHLDQRAGLGVDRHQFRRLDLAQPSVELLPGKNRVVLQVGHLRRARQVRLVEQVATGRRTRLFFAAVIPNQFRRNVMALKLPHQTLEAITLIKDFQRRRVLAADHDRFERGQPVDVPLQVAIGFHRQQLATARQPFHGLAQVLAHRALDLIRARQQRVDRPVLQQQLDGSLRADLVDARHVVHRVADQHLVVDHQARRHAELGLDAGDIALAVVHGVDHRHMLVDQLAQILVAA